MAAILSTGDELNRWQTTIYFSEWMMTITNTCVTSFQGVNILNLRGSQDTVCLSNSQSLIQRTLIISIYPCFSTHWGRVHYNDVIMRMMAFQITSLRIVYSTVYSSADQRKLQSSASLAFVRGIHRWPVNSSHKGPLTQKMFPFDDVIMDTYMCQ